MKVSWKASSARFVGAVLIACTLNVNAQDVDEVRQVNRFNQAQAIDEVRQASRFGRGEATFENPAATLPRITNAAQPQPESESNRANRPQRSERADRVDRPEKPERAELSEFQRFLQETTGKRLNRHGMNLFDAEANTFAPVDRIPVPADYVLGPGDELFIRGWGAIDLDFRVIIDRNGLIGIPRIGSVRVAGIKAGEVEGFLEKQMGRVFRNFNLNVTLGQLRSIQIFVVGQARRPGSYTVGSLSTLVNAVFASGGPAMTGSLRRIQLLRGGRQVAELDLYEFLSKGDTRGDLTLMPGDTIVYPAIGPQIALMGATDQPGIFELRQEGETLRQVLGHAGGLAPVTSLLRGQLERIQPGQSAAERKVESLSLNDEGLSRRLSNGDVVTLLRVEQKIANAVTLRGNVARPLRYPHSAGMRVSDLIPDQEALLTPDYFRRKNRLVQYLEPDEETVRDRIPTVTTRRIQEDPNWEYAVIERLDPADLNVRIIAFHLGRAVIDRLPGDNLELQPGDVVTIFGRRDLRIPQMRSTRVVRLDGEVARPGVYQLQPGETLKGLLNRAGGLTRQAYVYGTELLRESTRRKQREALTDAIRRLETQFASAAAVQVANLSTAEAAAAARLQAAQAETQRAQLQRLRALEPNGRIALELDPRARNLDDLPDLPLEDEDRIHVPVRPGFVHAVGSVANNNAIVWRSGRTLGDYLKAAGIEPGADEANIFVLRADGSVVHSRDHGVLFSSLRSLALAPGDTIVVPELLNRETFWTAFVRGLKDWTQIFSQLGIAAAVVNSLKN